MLSRVSRLASYEATNEASSLIPLSHSSFAAVSTAFVYDRTTFSCTRFKIIPNLDHLEVMVFEKTDADFLMPFARKL